MAELFFILSAISVLFFVALLVKEVLKKEFCAICASVSLTWLGLLISYWLRIFDDAIMLALLIGASTVGVFYIIEAKVRKEWTMFRLPFLLTLIAAGYSLVSVPDDLMKIVVFLIILWLFFIVAYLCRNNPKISSAAKRIVECCKRW